MNFTDKGWNYTRALFTYGAAATTGALAGLGTAFSMAQDTVTNNAPSNATEVLGPLLNQTYELFCNVSSQIDPRSFCPPDVLTSLVGSVAPTGYEMVKSMVGEFATTMGAGGFSATGTIATVGLVVVIGGRFYNYAMTHDNDGYDDGVEYILDEENPLPVRQEQDQQQDISTPTSPGKQALKTLAWHGLTTVTAFIATYSIARAYIERPNEHILAKYNTTQIAVIFLPTAKEILKKFCNVSSEIDPRLKCFGAAVVGAMTTEFAAQIVNASKEAGGSVVGMNGEVAHILGFVSIGTALLGTAMVGGHFLAKWDVMSNLVGQRQKQYTVL